jgi:SAM-dependent methyltransferase
VQTPSCGEWPASIGSRGSTKHGSGIRSFCVFSAAFGLSSMSQVVPAPSAGGFRRVEALPFEDSFFDAALCCGSLHLFADTVIALREIARVMKPAAILAGFTFGIGRGAYSSSGACGISIA